MMQASLPRHTRAADRAYGEAIRRLREALPDNQQDQDADTLAQRALDALRGMGPGAWIEFDERGGYRDAGWRFGLVRRMRNSPAWTRPLMDAINTRVPERPFA